MAATRRGSPTKGDLVFASCHSWKGLNWYHLKLVVVQKESGQLSEVIFIFDAVYIESIQKRIDTDNYYIIVVDNGSTNKSGVLLEKQYKQAYFHLPFVTLDEAFKRFEKSLYNYSPYRYEMLYHKDKTYSLNYAR